MKKRILSLTVALIMVLNMLPSLTLGAAASTPVDAIWGVDADSLTESGSFEDAITAATAQDSTVGYVRLQQDVSLGEITYIQGGAFTLDLNGFYFASTVYTLCIENDAHLTLDDTSSEELGSIRAAEPYAIRLYDQAKLTMLGGSIDANFSISVNDHAELEILDGHLNSSAALCIVARGASVTVSGGTFSSDEIFLQLEAGTLDLSEHPDPEGLTVLMWTGADVPQENVKLPDDFGWYDNTGHLATDALTNHENYTAMPLTTPNECIDEDGNSICDLCGGDYVCSHMLESPVENGDGTHVGVCSLCGEEVTEACVWYYEHESYTHHWTTCLCGYKFDEEEHSFEEALLYARGAHGHSLECDGCYFIITEDHVDGDENDECDVCAYDLTTVADVFIGGTPLQSGQYMDLLGNVTTTKPDGGYAYYADGTLELNDFVFEGSALCAEKEEYADAYAAIYTAAEVSLKLVGENEITTDRPDWGNGIFAGNRLTVLGDGKLTLTVGEYGMQVIRGDLTIGEDVEIEISDVWIGMNIEDGDLTLDDQAKLSISELGWDGINVRYGNINLLGDSELFVLAVDDGIYLVDGDVTVDGATVTLGHVELDGDGNLILNQEIGDDGIDATDGNIFIKSGKITIIADDHAFDVGGSITVTGGEIDADAGDDGFNISEDIVISGGTVRIMASDYGLDSDNGDVTIRGGTIEIEAGIGISCYDGTVEISGGEIDIISDAGIVNSEVLRVTDGKLCIDALSVAFVLLDFEIHGGEISVSTDHPIEFYGESGVITGGKFNFNPDKFVSRNCDLIYDTESESWTVQKTISMGEAEERIADLETALAKLQTALETATDKATAAAQRIAALETQLGQSSDTNTDTDTENEPVSEQSGASQALVIVTCVLAGIALCASGGVSVWFFLDKKKRA